MDAVKLSAGMKDTPWEALNILTRMGEGKETLVCGPDSVYLNVAWLSPLTRGSWEEGRRAGFINIYWGGAAGGDRGSEK